MSTSKARSLKFQAPRTMKVNTLVPPTKEMEPTKDGTSNTLMAKTKETNQERERRMKNSASP